MVTRLHRPLSAFAGKGLFLCKNARNQKERKRTMTTYDELVARGLIAQVTDEEEIKELVNDGKAVFYIGFDPTADRKSTRLNSSHYQQSRMPSSA